MPKYFLFLFCIIISVSVTAETVYKTTNPDGSVEFTDQNLIDSEEIELRKTQTYPAPPIRISPKKIKPAANYLIRIVKPVNNVTIIGNTEVTIAVVLSPQLHSGHQLRYQFGNRTINSYDKSLSFENLDRGTYILRVSVIDKEGEVVDAGATSTFHIKRFFKKPAP